MPLARRSPGCPAPIRPPTIRASGGGIVAALVLLLGACADGPTDPAPSELASALAPPAQAMVALRASQVATGHHHACALRTNGRAVCWGNNLHGQLGDGTFDPSTTPVEVAGGLRFARIGSAWQHTCALTRSGEAYCWGDGTFGQLGAGHLVASNVPVRVETNETLTDLSVGTYHSCAVTVDDDVLCWGADRPGVTQFGDRDGVGSALGAAGAVACSNPTGYRGDPWFCSPTPVRVDDPAGFADVSAGLWATCGVRASGAAVCWGNNGADQLGTGTPEYRTVPTPMAGGVAFEQVAMGALHGCGLAGSDAWCWGGRFSFFNSGALGNGGTTGNPVPAPVQGGLSWKLLAPSAANSIHMFTCGITTDAEAWCWGSNVWGQLGTASPLEACPLGACATTPVPVAGGRRFDALATGDGFACGVARDRSVHCWGQNSQGQLGDGTDVNRSVPGAVLWRPGQGGAPK